ncbi:MAG: isocitrate lyase/PEP mutase family protein [Halanaerobiales bacterium]
MNKGKIIKEYFEKGKILVSPGAFDAMSARIIDKVGFPSVYVTGYGASANLLGKPDIGLLGMKEMVDHVGRISDAVEGAVIADADTGYGNALNVMRTVREYEKAGADAIQLEDQTWPKRCGHMEGKQIIPAEEMVQKIKAAVDARRSEDTLIIARTDAIAVEGYNEAIRRAELCYEAGADILFVEAPEDSDQLAQIPQSIEGAPFMANMIEGGKTPVKSFGELEDMGYSLVIYPLSTLYIMTKAVKDLMDEMMRKDTPQGKVDEMASFSEFNEIVGLKEIRETEEKYIK